jgi:hypothetical protein
MPPAAATDAAGHQEVAGLAKPVSPLQDGRVVSGQPLESPANLTKALQTADTLAAFVQKEPAHPDAKAARVFEARLRLWAVAGAEGLGTEAATKALGGPGASTRQLRLALAGLEGADGERVAEVRLAVAASLGTDPEVKDVPFDYRQAFVLASGETDEGAALRAIWLRRLDQGLEALATMGTELRVEAASRVAGRILCSNCADAHHLTPDMVSRYLLKTGKVEGILCDQAVAAGPEVSALDALRTCIGRFGMPADTDPIYAWGANFVTVGLVQTAKLLAENEAAGPLAAPIRKRLEAIRGRLAKPIAMPVVAITSPPPKSPDEAPSAWPAQLSELGTGGLTIDARPEALLVVGPSEVRGGKLPQIKLDGATLIPEPGTTKVIELGALLEANKAPDGSVEAVVAFASSWTASAAQGTPRQATLVVDARAPAEAVERAVDSLRTAGFGQFFFEKTITHGRTLPLLVGEAPESVVTRIKPGYERPLIAVVNGRSVNIWEPAKPSDPSPTGDPAAKPPTAAEAGYRGTTLARLRVPLPPETTGLDAEAQQTISEALAYFLASSGAGRLLHVVAGEDARAQDVLTVARLFQEGKGTPLEKPEEIWPGTRCGGDDYRAAQLLPSDCPAGVAVAWSDLGEPTARLTPQPGEKKEEKPAEAKPAPPPPSGPTHCDKGDIAAGMAKRAGQFRFCYEKELQQNPELKGKVTLKFTIGLDGKLQGSPAIGPATLDNELVQRCILKTAEKLSFKPPDGGVCVVNWPFNFVSK